MNINNLYKKNRVYIPQDEVEEGILCLLLYEDQFIDSSNSQPKKINENEIDFYDDLCIAFSKRLGYKQTVEVSSIILFNNNNNFRFLKDYYPIEFLNLIIFGLVFVYLLLIQVIVILSYF